MTTFFLYFAIECRQHAPCICVFLFFHIVPNDADNIEATYSTGYRLMSPEEPKKKVGEVEDASGMEDKETLEYWGIVVGTLGRQGNPRILDRLEKKIREKGLSWTIVLMSELSPTRIYLFGDSVDAWILIACPRLSIDWGDAFVKPLLTPFEAEIALGEPPIPARSPTYLLA